jgi:hypothetical protein
MGYIIKRGDCVGKEKAVVKDIGLGYITFAVEPDEFSVQLNPKQLMVSDPELPTPAPRTTIAPVVPPPAMLPRGQGPAEAPAGAAQGSGRPAAQGPAPGATAPGATPATGSAAPAMAPPAAPPLAAPAPTKK